MKYNADMNAVVVSLLASPQFSFKHKPGNRKLLL